MSSIKYLRWLSREVAFPPMRISILEQIETKFRRLSNVFRVKLLNGANADIVGHTVQSEIQDGGSKTKFPYLGLYLGQNKIFQRLLSYCQAPLTQENLERHLTHYWRPLNPT
jgi:hypothetical protein